MHETSHLPKGMKSPVFPSEKIIEWELKNFFSLQKNTIPVNNFTKDYFNINSVRNNVFYVDIEIRVFMFTHT
jgi:hypothetical protein